MSILPRFGGAFSLCFLRLAREDPGDQAVERRRNGAAAKSVVIGVG
nr:MAG TPA: hypothetical protein [Caudoviricetes sp.]